MFVMKKIISMLLVLVMVLGMFAGCSNKEPSTEPTGNPTDATQAPVSVSGNTVILYTANVRGDVDVYAKVAAAKAAYEAEGATVYLVDAGNYLQGKGAANFDRGLSVYNLMDAAGYDVAGMGVYEFVYGDATTGYMYHGNVTKYHTQAQLYKGVEETEYRKNAPWAETAVMDTLAAKESATFKVICSNLSIGAEATGYYAFDSSIVLGDSLKVGFVSSVDTNVASYLQDNFLSGYMMQEVTAPVCDILVALGGEGDIVIEAATDGEMTVGAYLINNETKEVSALEVDLSGSDADVAALAENAKAEANVVAASDVILDGSDRANWNGQTNLGKLTADALKWYAENKFEGINKEYPVIAIQNGGNCDNFIYAGDITDVDILRALPFSPMGVGVMYMTGAQVVEMLEASTQAAMCPGWAQVSGIEYSVDTSKAYDAGEAYGDWFMANSINRVTVTSENFELEATYAVIADNFLMKGNDTYYTTAAIQETTPENYVANTADVKTRDIVVMYIDEVLDGTIGSDYAGELDAAEAESPL